MKYKYHIILFLVLASLTSSLLLSTQPISEICNLNEGCEVVQHSVYSSTFGIKNSDYGVAVFSVLALLTFSQIIKPKKYKKNIVTLGIIFSSLIAVYFLYLQQFVLNAYCKYCLTVDISMLIALFIIIFDRKWKK